MPRVVKELTDIKARQAKPKEKEYNLADGKGLYLRVKPSGSKLWIFNYYRPFSKKRANISLGAYPELPLTDARGTAVKYNGLLINGIDPQEYRAEQDKIKENAQSNTFQHVASKLLNCTEK